MVRRSCSLTPLDITRFGGELWYRADWVALGEYLEWIVIVLIAAEILVAAINIVVDLYAGVD
jgi:hypothetical protein